MCVISFGFSDDEKWRRVPHRRERHPPPLGEENPRPGRWFVCCDSYSEK